MARQPIKSVSKTIRAVEGFDVRFIVPGEDERDTDRRRVDEYRLVNAANKSWTVARWRAKRFEPNYPDFEVEVLKGDGSAVHGKTLLSTVRESYSFHNSRGGTEEPTPA